MVTVLTTRGAELSSASGAVSFTRHDRPLSCRTLRALYVALLPPGPFSSPRRIQCLPSANGLPNAGDGVRTDDNAALPSDAVVAAPDGCGGGVRPGGDAAGDSSDDEVLPVDVDVDESVDRSELVEASESVDGRRTWLRGDDVGDSSNRTRPRRSSPCAPYIESQDDE